MYDAEEGKMHRCRAARAIHCKFLAIGNESEFESLRGDVRDAAAGCAA